MSDNESTISGCYDCNLPYTDPGFADLIIPDWAWKKITPRPNGDGLEGLLCPTCICRRLTYAGIENCPSAFMSGPLNFDVYTAQSTWKYMKYREEV